MTLYPGALVFDFRQFEFGVQRELVLVARPAQHKIHDELLQRPVRGTRLMTGREGLEGGVGVGGRVSELAS